MGRKFDGGPVGPTAAGGVLSGAVAKAVSLSSGGPALGGGSAEGAAHAGSWMISGAGSNSRSSSARVRERPRDAVARAAAAAAFCAVAAARPSRAVSTSAWDARSTNPLARRSTTRRSKSSAVSNPARAPAIASAAASSPAFAAWNASSASAICSLRLRIAELALDLGHRQLTWPRPTDGDQSIFDGLHQAGPASMRRTAGPAVQGQSVRAIERKRGAPRHPTGRSPACRCAAPAEPRPAHFCCWKRAGSR